jgi:hypothetical protein
MAHPISICSGVSKSCIQLETGCLFFGQSRILDSIPEYGRFDNSKQPMCLSSAAKRSRLQPVKDKCCGLHPTTWPRDIHRFAIDGGFRFQIGVTRHRSWVRAGPTDREDSAEARRNPRSLSWTTLRDRLDRDGSSRRRQIPCPGQRAEIRAGKHGHVLVLRMKLRTGRFGGGRSFTRAGGCPRRFSREAPGEAMIARVAPHSPRTPD